MDSKALLKKMLGMGVRSFAYPNGTRKEFRSESPWQTLRELGYEYAVLLDAHSAGSRTALRDRPPFGETDLEHFRRLVQGFGLLFR